MPLIDTLRLKTNLELAGMDERPAAAIADALGHADVDQLATKADLAAVQAALKAVQAALKADIETIQTALKAEITIVKADVTALKAEIADIKADVKTLKADFKKGVTIIIGVLLTILVKLLFF